MRVAASLVSGLLLLLPAAAQAAVWGGFSGGRINYADGVVATGGAWDDLRAELMANGDTLAPPTAVLDAAYLGGVDVFITSLLNAAGPNLSAAEQTALQDWIASGGTLIVTADANPLPGYEAFTSAYGVTDLDPALMVTFTVGPDALVIANDDTGAPFAAVLEPDTGFCEGGRVVGLGELALRGAQPASRLSRGRAIEA
ncbi:MAG: hypothetical protein H6712_35300 [Myxococcales bacterium]|nr:hypothetical protein [Myxococcales bacterium]MCB9719163.1 hypothetical protein [Myxococcales bacterium]